ncbi:MAG: hypothetical protein NTX03_13040 [Bacteroidetes bacterium]|nr:hypothetical protein [Bacteroidota bacterium]
MKKLFLITVLICGFLLQATAQGNLDESLASEFYGKGEFDKAALLYKKLLDNNPANAFYYDNYLSCLLNLKDYKTAEREIKKLIKRNNDITRFQVDLGYIFSLENNEKDMKKVWDDVIQKIPPDEERIGYTANLFASRKANEYVLKTWLQGRKLFQSDVAFTQEIASIYRDKKEYQKMIDEYMNLFDKNPLDFDALKDGLQEEMAVDEPYDIFRKVLLKRIQEHPENINYSEMLSWLFMQHKDFNAAYIQAKAIDKRLKEGGRRLIELAKITTDYQQFDLSAKIYQSIIDEGAGAMYFVPAQRGLLDIRYARVTRTGSYTPEDVAELISSYQTFIDKYGFQRQESWEVILRLAEIKALYANKPTEAEQLLETFVASNAGNKTYIGKAKLALGDYYLMDDNVWEATLRYSQIEKMFKDDPLGHEAKFRNAKLSFYRGDFEWASAQLDVLKGSTSELIANDALQLALVIQENMDDSNERPLQLYADAILHTYRNQFAEAEKKMDSINTLYPGHSLEDELCMLRAEIAMKKRDYAAALKQYEKVYTTYGQDVLADDALYKAAQLQERYLNEPEKAKNLYEKLITEYKGSVYSVDARNRYRMLRGDSLN